MKKHLAFMNSGKANSSHRFLLAKFNVDYILERGTLLGIKQALSDLLTPERENEQRMDKTYNRIIGSIHERPRGIKKYAFRALSWICYATRALTTQELLAAISVEANQYHLDDSDMVGLEDLLDCCNGLVIADGQAVGFVHPSVRDYLDRHQVIPEDANETYRAIACSTYLSFDILKEQHFLSQNIDNLISDLPFLRYAANNCKPGLGSGGCVMMERG